MDFTGKIIHIADPRSGTSASGKAWTCREYVIEDASQRYPSRLCFTVFGEDRLRQFNIQNGETLTISFDIDAHEHNGRWFNSIQAYAVARPQPAGQPAFQGAAFMQPAMPQGAACQQPAQPQPSAQSLPF